MLILGIFLVALVGATALPVCRGNCEDVKSVTH